MQFAGTLLPMPQVIQRMLAVYNPVIPHQWSPVYDDSATRYPGIVDMSRGRIYS